MNDVMAAMPAGGSCEKEQKLFASPYLEDFPEDEFKADNPDAKATDVRAARVAHQRRQALIVAMAQKVCAECPMLVECQQFALNIEPSNVYGVLGGMTQETRTDLQNSANRANKNFAFHGISEDSATASLMRRYSDANN